jgi:hypothetical protein
MKQAAANNLNNQQHAKQMKYNQFYASGNKNTIHSISDHL